MRKLNLTPDCIYNNSIPEPNSGCWLWLERTNKGGYGVLKRRQVHLLAHRASFTLFKGPIYEGASVLHNCNNRLCVNPEHLRLGSDFQNAQDKIRSGNSRTNVFLAAHKKRRILSHLEEEVRAMYATGKYKQQDLSRRFKVSNQTIGRILKGRLYAS